MTKGKKILIALAIPVALFLLIQVVPYGRDHDNPPITREPTWSSPQARELAKRACFDCHSNETVWPWYSNIAPVSWLVASDVEEGRSKLNFSEWDKPQRKWKDAGEEIEDGEMPMPIYIILHKPADLSDAEKTGLTRGIEALEAPPGGEDKKGSANGEDPKDKAAARQDDDDDDD